MVDEVDELRRAVARALRIQICGTPSPDVEPTPKQIRDFFTEKLNSRVAATSGNYKVHGYSASRAREAIKSILEGRPYFEDGIGMGKNAAFETKLIQFLNGPSIGLPSALPAKFFRKGFGGKAESFADIGMIAEGKDADFIVNQLFDLFGANGYSNSPLESSRIMGMYIVAVVRLLPSDGSRAIGSITFSDLFDYSIEVDTSGIDFGECKVDAVRRINPENKPCMSNDDFIDHIFSVYKTPKKHLGSENAIYNMKKDFLEKCIRVFIKLVVKYLEPLQELLDESLGCGRLPRTVLDVEHGVLLARQVDQGRLWVLALSPIQDTVDECDELFGRAIIRPYEQALKLVRSRRA